MCENSLHNNFGLSKNFLCVNSKQQRTHLVFTCCETTVKCVILFTSPFTCPLSALLYVLRNVRIGQGNELWPIMACKVTLNPLVYDCLMFYLIKAIYKP